MSDPQYLPAAPTPRATLRGKHLYRVQCPRWLTSPDYNFHMDEDDSHGLSIYIWADTLTAVGDGLVLYTNGEVVAAIEAIDWRAAYMVDPVTHIPLAWETTEEG